MKFSVIVASHNEGPQIASALKRLRQISKTSPVEVIVADGASDDETVSCAREWADEVVVLPRPNRGEQWDAGAQKATGELLLFLRADVQLPGNWQQALEHFWLVTPIEKVAAVAFCVDYGRDWDMSLLSWWSNARARAGLVLADHGLCTTPEIYRAAGGYPAFAELEDFELSRRLRTRGSIALLPESVHPSARRMRSQGPFAYVLGRVWREARYRMGASPDSLFRQ